MATFVAEDFDHQIRRAVNHPRLVNKLGGTVHKAHQLDDPHHPVEVAIECLGQLGNDRQAAGARCHGTGLDLHVFAQSTGLGLAIDHGDLPGDEQQIAGPHRGHIVGHRGGGVGEGYAEFAQARVDGASHGRSPYRSMIALAVSGRAPGASAQKKEVRRTHLQESARRGIK